eukprot:4434982-Karenia_brevis.AAC.1
MAQQDQPQGATPKSEDESSGQGEGDSGSFESMSPAAKRRRKYAERKEREVMRDLKEQYPELAAFFRNLTKDDVGAVIARKDTAADNAALNLPQPARYVHPRPLDYE